MAIVVLRGHSLGAGTTSSAEIRAAIADFADRPGAEPGRQR
jgi:hypothetical protein